MPKYDFIAGEKYYRDDYLQVDDDTVIIIEGLHSLNDELTLSIERNLKYKIYISPLTQLNIDNHNRIHTSDTRKLRRRIIKGDNRTRGYNATETLNMCNVEKNKRRRRKVDISIPRWCGCNY